MVDYGNKQKHLNPNPAQRVLLNRFHRQIIKLVRQTGATYLLDAGCGEGFVVKHLRQWTPQLEIVGADFSVEALRWGQTHLKLNVPLVNGDVQRLPFADNTFPLAICLEVLEHLPDSKIGLRELARVSSEYVLLSVPHEPWFRGANLARGRHVSAWGSDPEHLHNYSGASFRYMVGSVVDLIWHGYAFPWQIALGRKRR
jgi:SAM-dependent methyltransferase